MIISEIDIFPSSRVEDASNQTKPGRNACNGNICFYKHMQWEECQCAGVFLDTLLCFISHLMADNILMLVLYNVHYM